MKSNWVKFLVLCVIGFALGAAFATYQQKKQAPPVPPVAVSKVATTEKSAPTTSPAPAPEHAPLEVIVPTHPVIEGTPPMPTPPGSENTVAGVPIGGPFSLTDHHGNPVTEKSWPGKDKLVFFGFTTCPDTCPATAQKLAAVMQSFDPEGKKIVPLFITVDPENDTKEVMAKFIERYGQHLVGLVGTPAQIKAVEDVYKVYAAKNGEAVDHSAYIYLMSPDDKLLETFPVEATAEEMITKIKLHFQ